MKHILILPDGSHIGSGSGAVSAIKSVTLTRTVNDGASVTPGSAVASELEVSLFTPGGGLALTAGQEVQLLRVDDTGAEHPLGIFLLEKPLRPSPNTMRITGFDRLVKLDKDLTAWLSGLTGWPYPLLTFAKMVCAECGLTLITQDVPNADYPIAQFTREGVTGRQLIRWLGELCCRYCIANAAGALEFNWYTDSGIHLAPGGEDFYFQNGLSYEDYTLQPPEAALTGNPLVCAAAPHTEAALQTVARELSGLSYTPCKVTVAAASPLQPGHRFTVTTPAGEILTSVVMTRADAPGKTSLESTGSPRGSTADRPLGQEVQAAADRAQHTAVSQAAADATGKADAVLSVAKTYADSAAAGAVNAQTQTDIFNKLTGNGQEQGIYMQDGKIYINASYLASGIIDAAVVQVANLVAEKLMSESEESCLKIDGASLRMYWGSKVTANLWNALGTPGASPILYLHDVDKNGERRNSSELSAHHISIGGTSMEPKFNVGISRVEYTNTGEIEEWSEMEVDSINPGKTKLFSGNVTIGNTCTVPNTDRYDLFAIRLGDSETNTFRTVVLAYKTGNVVRGVGGWAGTATESKQLFFFSAAIDGDTWTLEDAGFHYVYIGGGVEEGIRLNLKEVIGVI